MPERFSINRYSTQQIVERSRGSTDKNSQINSPSIVFEVETVGSMRQFLVTLLSPGETQSVYFLDRKSPGSGATTSWCAPAGTRAGGQPAMNLPRSNAPLRLPLPGQNPYRPRISSRALTGPEWGMANFVVCPSEHCTYLRS
jgi:hypothetical protein